MGAAPRLRSIKSNYMTQRAIAYRKSQTQGLRAVQHAVSSFVMRRRSYKPFIRERSPCVACPNIRYTGRI